MLRWEQPELGRSKSKLAEFKSARAEVLTGDAGDSTFLTKAFRGADAVYSLLPTDPREPDYQGGQRQEGEAINTAIRESAVPHVVALSSLGADLNEGTGSSRACMSKSNASRALTASAFSRTK